MDKNETMDHNSCKATLNDNVQYMKQLYKFVKNLNLIGTSSDFLHNIRTCIYTRKIIKMKNSLLFNFGETSMIQICDYHLCRTEG